MSWLSSQSRSAVRMCRCLSAIGRLIRSARSFSGSRGSSQDCCSRSLYICANSFVVLGSGSGRRGVIGGRSCRTSANGRRTDNGRHNAKGVRVSHRWGFDGRRGDCVRRYRHRAATGNREGRGRDRGNGRRGIDDKALRADRRTCVPLSGQFRLSAVGDSAADERKGLGSGREGYSLTVSTI